MGKATRNTRKKVDAIREKAKDLGWPESRLEALERCIDDRSLGEVSEDWIEMIDKSEAVLFFRDRESSLQWANDRLKGSQRPKTATSPLTLLF